MEPATNPVTSEVSFSFPSTDIMVDLETMGTDPYSPVVAIGAVRFNSSDVRSLVHLQESDTFYVNIKLESAMAAGLKPSASTILWWLRQSAEAREMFSREAQTNAVELVQALDAFTDWHNSGTETLWGNSAAFDLGLLKDCYRALNKPEPWLFYKEGCYRTLKTRPAVEHIELRRIGTHHNAMDDALSQAYHLCDIVKHLGANTPVPQPTTESI